VDRGFVVVVGVVARGRDAHSSLGPNRGGRPRWEAAALVEDEALADAIARLLRERSPGVKVRVVSLRGLVAGVGGEQAERILDGLRNRTTADTERSRQLERDAAKLPRVLERRSEADRRRGGDRRVALTFSGPDRRVNGERRSGTDRREARPVPVAG
jgi:hypothetical protein